jgi:uncharacterized protein (TIGR03067 family)
MVLTIASTAPALATDANLQGAWIATAAQRDGQAVDDVVGHRLAFSDDDFRIQSKDGKPLYAGTVQIDPSANPAAIDFIHRDGPLDGKAWKGIYTLDGDILKICDNAPNLDAARPTTLEAPANSGYVLITFERAKP